MGLHGLRVAVPRGALLGETLDLLDRLGADTSEVRGNDRKLLFEEAGLVTMRPSDVPIYVEAGAADLGITGKDVLAEHPERDVYELLDLGFGPCRMVFATEAGDVTIGVGTRDGKTVVRGSSSRLHHEVSQFFVTLAPPEEVRQNVPGPGVSGAG